MIDLAFLRETFATLVSGVPLTLQLAALSSLLGAIFALLLVWAQVALPSTLGRVARVYVFAFRGTPLLVQLFLIYYGLSQFRPTLSALGLWGLLRDPYWCAVLALMLNTAAYCAEIFRGGLQAVPAGQVEAARAAGFSGFLLFRRIVFPIALRQALPGYGNELVLMVKATSLASTVTLMEITGLAAKAISQSYRAIEVFLVAGALYLALNVVLVQALGLLERRLMRHLAR